MKINSYASPKYVGTLADVADGEVIVRHAEDGTLLGKGTPRQVVNGAIVHPAKAVTFPTPDQYVTAGSIMVIGTVSAAKPSTKRNLKANEARTMDPNAQRCNAPMMVAGQERHCRKLAGECTKHAAPAVDAPAETHALAVDAILTALADLPASDRIRVARAALK